jgi:multidrug efflux pump subunit AcrA (membrane-fusion protein)
VGEVVVGRDVRIVWAACALALAGCAGGEAPGERARASAPGAPEAPAPAKESFVGVVEPTSSTELRAPRNYFRVGTWQSDSGWIKLEHIAPDGKEVEEGDVLARFEFNGQQALEYVRGTIQNAQASAERADVAVDEEMGRLKTGVERLALDAERARLDTMKEGVVSARDLERFGLDHDLAVFDAQAEKDRLGAYRRTVAADRAYHERDVARANSMQARFDAYKERFKVRAPHDGVFRHAFMQRQRRKVQKGDGMRSGQEFASVARDRTVEVKFFVPERRFALLDAQETFTVLHPTDDSTYAITVHKIDPFPQELGFLLDDDELSNAREKMFVVHASFDAPPEGLAAGLEVKVVTR